MLFVKKILSISKDKENNMPRIVGVNIPDQKKLHIALTYIYGVGKFSARRILKETGIDSEKRAKDLTPGEISKLKQAIEADFKIEGKLKRAISMDIKRLIDIKSWRGSRHVKGLPVRGQTTRINSRTARGNVRRTMGSGRAKALAHK